jgi:hypothetical protein
LSELPEGAHDRYLANYHRGTASVWCANKECVNHADGCEIDTETEYGFTVYLPEECPLCHGEWLDDKPEEEEEES